MTPSSDELELIEKLAAIEHERWADWQRYVLEDCAKTNYIDQLYFDSPAQIAHWKRQIRTPYSELSEREKQSDRDQVMRYWPLLKSREDAAYFEAANAMSAAILGQMKILREEYIGRGGKNHKDYWRGFTDLEFALAEFMGKELAAQATANMHSNGKGEA